MLPSKAEYAEAVFSIFILKFETTVVAFPQSFEFVQVASAAGGLEEPFALIET